MLESVRVADQLRQFLGSESAAASVATPRDNTITIANPSSDSDRLIEVRIRDDFDVEIAFIVPAKPGSPFEQVFSGPTPEADMVLREALSFVGDLIADHLAWVVSWRGTHDWNAPVNG